MTIFCYNCDREATDYVEGEYKRTPLCLQCLDAFELGQAFATKEIWAIECWYDEIDEGRCEHDNEGFRIGDHT